MPLSLFSINQKSILALLLSGLILFGAGAAFVDADLSWMPDWIENNDLNFGGFSNFIDAAAGAGLSEEETKAMIVALINSKFGDEDFLTVLREQNASAADKLKIFASTSPTFKQELDKINVYAKTSQAQIDKQNIQKQITTAAANNNENKAQAIKTYQAKIDTGTATEKDKEAYIAALRASGDTIVTDPLTGKSWAYSSYDPSDPKNKKGKNVIDTAAQFSLDTGYDPCLDGFMVGGGDEGGGSGSGSGKASVVCNTYIYNDWGSCAGGTQSRTIFSKGPSGCTDTSSAQLTQPCVIPCTSYTYSDWSACVSGSQSRTIKTQSPAGCTNTSTADLTNDCTGDNGTVCTSYTYSDWSACVSGSQSRSMLSRVPSGCTDTSSAIFTQSCGVAQPPIVANTTNSIQTSSNPVLSVITNQPAVCQYAEEGGFSYGNGATFNTTGGYNHNTGLSNINSGQHTFYVICKDNATGGISAALKIDFNVNLSTNPATTTDDCADLSSNDRKSDANRSNSGGGDANSSYLWQSVETGTRERFSNVDWYAGYQFTPEKDGRITQLCGYFDSGATNKVSIYNGSYAEIASAQVAGNGSWKCVDISPLAINADNRYYAIARVQNNPIYFEYRSGMLPRESGNAIIEAGVRQTIIDKKFKTDVVKYDYMIFGLVDVKISYDPASISGPVISSVGPVGTIDGSSATISAQTDQQSSCKFDREDIAYSSMKYAFSSSLTGNFSQKVCELENGNYTFYVRCKNAAGGKNNASKIIQFSISR